MPNPNLARQITLVPFCFHSFRNISQSFIWSVACHTGKFGHAVVCFMDIKRYYPYVIGDYIQRIFYFLVSYLY